MTESFKLNGKKPENIKISVKMEEAGRRLDQLLALNLPEFSRAFLQSLIIKGKVLVNGSPKKNSYIVRASDSIEITFPIAEPAIIKPVPIPLDILHEDDDIIVINKKAGIVVHPAYGHRDDTLVNALLSYNPKLSTISGVERPGIIHRLDKDTSGVMIIAKNDNSHRHLSSQFRERSVEKIYLCFVRGKPRDAAGKISAAIGRDPHNRKKFAVLKETGKEAESIYEVIKSYPFISFMKIRIKTGRTHQVRLHMAHIGCPVIGDKTYGRSWRPINAPKELLSFLKELDRIMLHSYRITVKHPTENQLKTFIAPLPREFEQLQSILDKMVDTEDFTKRNMESL